MLLNIRLMKCILNNVYLIEWKILHCHLYGIRAHILAPTAVGIRCYMDQIANEGALKHKEGSWRLETYRGVLAPWHTLWLL